MKIRKIALSVGLTENDYYVVINDIYYIRITEKQFKEFAKALNIKIDS